MDYEIFFEFARKIFLAPANPFIILLLVLIMYKSFYRIAFMRALFIALCALLINENLKLFFQVPYALAGFQGFAFPSGHTIAVVSFWGWLIYEYPKRIVILTSFSSIASVLFWLLYSGQHRLNEVITSFFLACFLILFFSFLLKKYKEITEAELALALLLLSIPLAIILGPTVYYRNVTTAQGLLLGFWLGKLSFSENTSYYDLCSLKSLLFLVNISLLAFSSYLMIFLFFSFFSYQLSSAQTFFLHSFFITFFLPSPFVLLFVEKLNKLILCYFERNAQDNDKQS